LPTDLGLYLHFPFCLSKCAYCDFASSPLDAAGGLPLARRYVNALAVELDLRAATEEFFGATVDTIFLGGGTPTVLPVEWLTEVLARVKLRLRVPDDAEITVEANPGTVDEAKLSALRTAGCGRLSLGVQSFSDDSLALLGRAHTAAEAKEAIAATRAAGFDNLNLDLIYGLPGQAVEEWRGDVEEALEFGPEHISAYGLSLEPGTRLEQAVDSGRLPEPMDDSYAEMYHLAEEAFTAAGYEHYEISNYARPGRECRHNRKYWSGDEYLGLGSSAHSHRRGRRWNNSPASLVYCEWLERGRLPVARAEALSARARVGELLMLGLRCAEGVSEDDVTTRAGLRPSEVFGEEIARLCERGMLVAADGRLRMPREKWLVSNEALAEFVL
jgi:oxygen-independent coproporphyrinogen-3 oxidase